MIVENRCEVSRGDVGGRGGGVMQSGGCRATLLLANGTIVSGNQAASGGAIVVESQALLKVTSGTRIVNNAAVQEDGGAIIAQNIEMDDAVLSGNEAKRHAGAVYLITGKVQSGDLDARATFRKTDIFNNRAGSTGGAVRNSLGVLMVEHVRIRNNSAGAVGGALMSSGGELHVSHSELTENIARAPPGRAPIRFAAVPLANPAAARPLKDCQRFVHKDLSKGLALEREVYQVSIKAGRDDRCKYRVLCPVGSHSVKLQFKNWRTLAGWNYLHVHDQKGVQRMRMKITPHKRATHDTQNFALTNQASASAPHRVKGAGKYFGLRNASGGVDLQRDNQNSFLGYGTRRHMHDSAKLGEGFSITVNGNVAVVDVWSTAQGLAKMSMKNYWYNDANHTNTPLNLELVAVCNGIASGGGVSATDGKLSFVNTTFRDNAAAGEGEGNDLALTDLRQLKIKDTALLSQNVTFAIVDIHAGAHCCRSNGAHAGKVPDGRAPNASSCEAPCAKLKACNFFSHSTARKSCVLCSRCTLKETGKARNLANKGASGCTSSKKCGECEGNCDRDSDCKTGLTCFQRTGKRKVPGCGGGGGDHDVGNYDFCYDTKNIQNGYTSWMKRYGDSVVFRNVPDSDCARWPCEQDERCVFLQDPSVSHGGLFSRIRVSPSNVDGSCTRVQTHVYECLMRGKVERFGHEILDYLHVELVSLQVFLKRSLACARCEANMNSSNGIACHACTPGQYAAPAHRAPRLQIVAAVCIQIGVRSAAAGRSPLRNLTRPNSTTEFMRTVGACTECPVGRAGTTGLCRPCSLGRVSAHTGAQFCAKCAAGQVATQTGKTVCVRCKQGQRAGLG